MSASRGPAKVGPLVRWSGEEKRATGVAVEPRSGETRFAAQPRNAPATSEMRTKVAGSGEWKRATGLAVEPRSG
ncbi:MAG: hypothetical protein M8865_11420, partial [marine benthic group bacterium]|nr:hypothetical protein [Gemmatimonadota bacterium]